MKKFTELFPTFQIESKRREKSNFICTKQEKKLYNKVKDVNVVVEIMKMKRRQKKEVEQLLFEVFQKRYITKRYLKEKQFLLLL